MLTTIPIIKYALPALLGAATKTYLDWKENKVGFGAVIAALIMNSVIAFGVGALSAHAFTLEFPEKEHFGYSIAFFGGAIGVNVVMALYTVDWKQIIESRIKK